MSGGPKSEQVLPSGAGENTDSHKGTMSGALLIDRSLGENPSYPPNKIGGLFFCVIGRNHRYTAEGCAGGNSQKAFFCTSTFNRIALARAHGMERSGFTICVV